MIVKSAKTYAAYARDVSAGGGDDALRVCALQSLEPPLFPFGERVRGEDGKADGVVEIAHHRTGKLVGVNLPPAHRFGWRRARQTACIGPRVGHLEVVVVPLFADAQDLLDLRLRLQHEVLRAAPADDQDT